MTQIQNPLELPFITPVETPIVELATPIAVPIQQPIVTPTVELATPIQQPIVTLPNFGSAPSIELPTLVVPQPVTAEPRQPRMTEKQRMAIIVQFIKTGVQPMGYVVKEDENGGYRVTTVKSKDPIVEAQKKRERYMKKLLELDPTLKDKFEPASQPVAIVSQPSTGCQPIAPSDPLVSTNIPL